MQIYWSAWALAQQHAIGEPSATERAGIGHEPDIHQPSENMP